MLKRPTLKMRGEFYVYGIRHGRKMNYLIWLSGKRDRTDGVVMDGGGIPVFASKQALSRYAAERGLHIEPQDPNARLNLDAVSAWTNRPGARSIDCRLFLNAWNLFGDVESSLRGKWSGFGAKRDSKLYDKLFWGNNLPAVTPEGKKYEPIWSREEVRRLAQLMSRGVRLFAENARPTTP